MADFTRVLYLGLRQPGLSLPSWADLTSGVPASLEEPQITQETAQELADLVGCARAVLAPSTLHLFWDVFGIISHKPSVIYIDAGAYPIGRWGAERAAARGAILRTFRHHDTADLLRLMAHHPAGWRAIILVDGVSACCGAPAPLRAYLAALPPTGWLIVDDTQALGLLGGDPDHQNPYGIGGGGSLRFQDLQDERIISVSSMAKGFGVPAALLTGSKTWIEHFKNHSETRLHCSPVSYPSTLAARQALILNKDQGDRLRRRLARLVRRFRSNLEPLGIGVKGGLFPVQTLDLPRSVSAVRVHDRLRKSGIRTVLRRCNHDANPCLSFVITARHTPDLIDQAIFNLAKIF